RLCVVRRFSSLCALPSSSEVSALSLHDALPISRCRDRAGWLLEGRESLPRAGSEPESTMRANGLLHSSCDHHLGAAEEFATRRRSEEHMSELQSHLNLVCRLLLEKKKTNKLMNV